MSTKKSINFDAFFIESPTGKKIIIHPLNAFAPAHFGSVLAQQEQDEKFYGQIVDAFAELDECEVFVVAQFNPKIALEMLKLKGYKVYWQP